MLVDKDSARFKKNDNVLDSAAGPVHTLAYFLHVTQREARVATFLINVLICSFPIVNFPFLSNI